MRDPTPYPWEDVTSRIRQLEADVARLRNALEKIERIDRYWTSFPTSRTTILDRGSPGRNVLVHGSAGQIAAAALSSPSAGEGGR